MALGTGLFSREKGLKTRESTSTLLVHGQHTGLCTGLVCLGISEADTQPFLSSCDRCAQRCIEALEMELSRCRELRKDNLPPLTNAIRDYMIHLWMKAHISSEERSMFHGFSEVEYTEELLDQREEVLEKLREFYKAKEDILGKVVERNKLWK